MTNRRATAIINHWKKRPYPRTVLATLVLWLVLQQAPLRAIAPQEEKSRDFGFGSMELFQFSGLTSDLQTCDINRDGKDDILFLNNKASRLEILIRLRKEVPHEGLPSLQERFINQGFVVDNWVRRFIAQDLNDDQEVDIILMDNRHGLLIYIGKGGGEFRKPESLHVKDAAGLRGFRTGDLNKDGRIDILVFRPEDAEILWNDESGKFKSRSLIAFSSYDCRGAIITDANGDAWPDLLFVFPKEFLPLRFRPGAGQGEFGWEESLALPDIRVMELLEWPGRSEKSRIAVILKNGLVLRLYEFSSAETGAFFTTPTITPRRLPLKGTGKNTFTSWVSGDLNGDGLDDFCIAAPLLSQIHLYPGRENELDFNPTAIDSLREIKKMLLTGLGDIVVFSEVEKAIAIHDRLKMSMFPVILKAPGEPVAMTVSGESTIIGLFEEAARDKTKKSLFTLNLFEVAEPKEAPFAAYPLELPGAPLDIHAFPLEGETNDLGILVFMPYDKPLLYRLTRGKLRQLPAEHFRPITSPLKPEESVLIPMGSGVRLLVLENNVARLYRWQGDRFIVTGQLNAGVEGFRITSGCRAFGDGAHIFLYSETERDLFSFTPGLPKETLRLHIDNGLRNPAGLAVLNLNKRRCVLLVGKSEVQMIPEHDAGRALTDLGEYVSMTEKPSLWNLYPVLLGKPGRPMVALMDTENRSLELVSITADGKISGELKFEVFQDPGFANQLSETVYEPHDIVSGDFNGDGVRDLALLVHDKLLLYLGE